MPSSIPGLASAKRFEPVRLLSLRLEVADVRTAKRQEIRVLRQGGFSRLDRDIPQRLLKARSLLQIPHPSFCHLSSPSFSQQPLDTSTVSPVEQANVIVPRRGLNVVFIILLPKTTPFPLFPTRDSKPPSESNSLCICGSAIPDLTY